MEEKLDLKTISAEFSEEILYDAVDTYYKKKYGRNAPEIATFAVSYASGKGDGFLGVIYRIRVDFTNKDISSISLIGKGMPHNITRRKTLRSDSFFANEIFFFKKVVPAFIELQKEKLGENLQAYLAIPDCYYAMSDGMNDFLILEDLNQDGYANVDKAGNLSVEQISEVLKVFARFHAFSLALNHCYPDKFKELADQATETEFTRENCLWPDRYISSFSNCFQSAIKSELDEKYVNKFETSMKPENLLPKLYISVESRDNKSVFNHGDLWITNLMFKENSMKTIDFQLMRLGNPMLDVSTIILSCTDQVERDQLGGTKGMFQLYVSELNQTVTSLGAPPSAGYTTEEMMKIWPEFGVLGFAFAVEALQLCLIDSNDVQDLDRFDSDEPVSFADIMTCKEVESKEGKRRLANLLKFAVDEGVI